MKRETGFIHVKNNYAVTWAVGHLVTLVDADEYDARFKKWNVDDLPIVPSPFKLKTIASSREQFKIVSNLLKQASEVIVATDAGREGQLIYELIAIKAGYKGATKRLWLSSMTEDAIKNAFRKLRDNKDFQSLFFAGFARSQADWLVGINVTRAITVKAGGLLPVGRVQTPTLAMIVNRDESIEQFQSTPYYEVQAEFTHPNGTYKGKWVNQKDKSSRFEDREQAKHIAQKVQGQPGQIVKLEQKTTKEQSPQLFDLTSLQRRANQLFGFTADHTLKIAQALYETHKILTYPRTDSRYISDDIVPSLHARLEAATQLFDDLRQYISTIIKPSKRVVNASKVADHHAIIPTEKPGTGSLSKDERLIYELVTKQTMAALMENAEWANTLIETTVQGESFRTSGRVLIKAGWRAVMGKQADAVDKKEDDDEEDNLPLVSKQDQVAMESVNVLSKQTKPPHHFTEASLLSAMENAEKQVEDDQLAEAMKERGLGTPATRASIIEKLKKDGYIATDKKKLLSTLKGRQLINAIQVNALKSPELTGIWEHKLKQIEQGQYDAKQFISEIVSFTTEVIEQLKHAEIHVEQAPRGK